MRSVLLVVLVFITSGCATLCSDAGRCSLASCAARGGRVETNSCAYIDRVGLCEAGDQCRGAAVSLSEWCTMTTGEIKSGVDAPSPSESDEHC